MTASVNAKTADYKENASRIGRAMMDMVVLTTTKPATL